MRWSFCIVLFLPCPDPVRGFRRADDVHTSGRAVLLTETLDPIAGSSGRWARRPRRGAHAVTGPPHDALPASRRSQRLTASARVLTDSFEKMLLTWFLTVFSDRKKVVAILLFVYPSAMRSMTSVSRRVRSKPCTSARAPNSALVAPCEAVPTAGRSGTVARAAPGALILAGCPPGCTCGSAWPNALLSTAAALGEKRSPPAASVRCAEDRCSISRSLWMRYPRAPARIAAVMTSDSSL